MADAEDAHGVVFESEQDTVISEPEPERAGHIAVQRSHVAGAGVGETENPFKQAHGGRLVHRANVGFGFIEPARTRQALPPSEYPCRAVQTRPARCESAGGLARLR